MAKRPDETPAKRRFWQASRNLTSVIWDSKRNRPLVRFTRGTALVEDPAIAELLLAKGYVEIPVEEVERPVPRIDVAAIHGLAMSSVQPGISAKDLGITDGGFNGHDSRPGTFAIED